MLQKEIYNNLFNKKANVVNESNDIDFDRLNELVHDSVMLTNIQRAISGLSNPNQALFRMVKTEYEHIMTKLRNEFRLIKDIDEKRAIFALKQAIKQGTEDSKDSIHDNVNHVYDFLIEQVY